SYRRWFTCPASSSQPGRGADTAVIPLMYHRTAPACGSRPAPGNALLVSACCRLGGSTRAFHPARIMYRLDNNLHPGRSILYTALVGHQFRGHARATPQVRNQAWSPGWGRITGTEVRVYYRTKAIGGV